MNSFLMLRRVFLWATSAIVIATVSQPAVAGIAILHSFLIEGHDAQDPFGELALSGSSLIGTSLQGGSKGTGAMYKLDLDGDNYEILHDFAGGKANGSNPRGGVLLDGTTVIGSATSAGPGKQGVLYSMGADGSNFQIIHAFTGGAADGAGPMGSLVKVGSSLYGTTNFGGSANLGTIFKINADGSGFEILHAFAGGAADGSNPRSTLITDGTKLYGTTDNGGSNGGGTVFTIGADGAGFQILRSFTGGFDGLHPGDARLLLNGNTLYGTSGANSGHFGIVFKLGTDATGYQVLHHFQPILGDGGYPSSGLVMLGSELYGTTSAGGSLTSDGGVLYRIGLDGAGYEIVHTFLGGHDDPYIPVGELSVFGSSIYGTSRGGGRAGTVYSYTVPEPSTALPLAMGMLVLGGASLAKKRRFARPTVDSQSEHVVS